MSVIYESAEALIGNTPLLELKHLEAEEGLKARILAKLEYLNPAGSAKDRVGRALIDDAEKRGLLQKGGTVIEPTSGNTGIGLAMVAALRGYRAVIVMPDTMSEERRKTLKAYGAELVLSDGSLGMSGAIALAEEIQKKTPGSFIAGQFENPANAAAHYETTGPEIFRDTDGNVDWLVAGVGTGGTLTGTGRFLKEQIPGLRIAAVEPAGSPVLSGGQAGKHDLQGIGAGFVPGVLDRSLIDEILTVTDEEAYETGRKLAAREGILVGITSGAAVAAAVRLARREENHGKTFAVILPDTGVRYLSTRMFEE